MGLAIVAIPAEDDYVWRISSEKVPHCTLCFLGEVDDKPVDRISAFLGHAVRSADFQPFGLSVDHRGILGDDKADVLFFKRDRYSFKRLEEFRGQLLKNNDIRDAYDSADQFPEWLPHLTLGYPESPAKPDKRDYPGIQYVQFDRIALWTGNYQGPWFRLEYNDDLAEVGMSAVADAGQEFVLEHFGVKGMKWGVRKSPEARAAKKVAKADKKFEKRAGTLGTFIDIHNRAATLTNKHDIDRINNKPEYKDKDFTKPSPLRDKYHQEHVQAFQKRLEQAAGEHKNASGTRKYDVMIEDDGSWSVFSKDIKHEDFTLKLNVITDKKGKITKLAPVATSMEQSAAGIDFLAHYGIKGMKWGVRKDRTSEVTTESVINRGLRRKTKVKAKGGEGQPAHDDAVKVAAKRQTLKKSGTAALSNKDLQEIIQRSQLEQQAKLAVASSGKKFVSKTLGNVGQQQVQRELSEQATKAVKNAKK